MKSSLLVCAAVLCASPSVLPATPLGGIEMLSQNYQITAQWVPGYTWYNTDAHAYGDPYPLGDWSAGYQVLPSGQITGGYNVSSSDGSPLAASTIAPSPTGSSAIHANASIDQFSFHNEAGAGSQTGVPAPLGGTLMINGDIKTSARAIWDFRPTGSQLNVNIAAGFANVYGTAFSGLTIQLLDKTGSTALLDIVESGSAYSPPSFSGGDFTFGVDPNHVYEFGVYGWSDTFASDFAYQSVKASISSSIPSGEANTVPETPSSVVAAFLLLPLALQGIPYLRNRKKAA